MTDPRTSRLLRLFNDTISGRRPLSTSRDGKLFLESLCAQPDPATCAHQILSNAAGLSSIQSSMRFDTSISFLNGDAQRLLQYIQAPSLANIDSGTVLAQIITNIVEPPFFWDAFTNAFKAHHLEQQALHEYAWLLLQLVSLPGINSTAYIILAKSPGVLDVILKAEDGGTRILGEKIKHALPLDAVNSPTDTEDKPGGRHNNDHLDHRQISVMPTADELLSKERPFLRTADFLDDPALSAQRRALHLDNQFRLLREDMLGEIRDELKSFTNTATKPGRHRGIVIDGLLAVGVEMGEERRRHPWGIILQCQDDLSQLKGVPKDKRKSHLVTNNQILRHNTIACLLLDGEPAAFPTIYRDVEKLSGKPPKFLVQFQDDSTLSYALLKFKSVESIRLIQLDTAIFAFSPFLKRLQEMRDIPLAEELLHWEEGDSPTKPESQPISVIRKLSDAQGRDLKDVLGTKKSVHLNDSQTRSLVASLSQKVSIVQGPPGTGKSFVGALVAKVLHDFTSKVILVVCFTNHALDQFLEDLLDVGIPPGDMIRLGGKSTDRTKPLTLKAQASVKVGRTNWGQVDKYKERLREHEKKIRESFGRYQGAFQQRHLMEYLEFLSEDIPYYDAFSMPEAEEDGMVRVGKSGKKMSPYYLLDRWVSGEKNAGSLHYLQPESTGTVWSMTPDRRAATMLRWKKAMLEDHIAEVREAGREFNADELELQRVFGERDASIIRTKKIIACTTNGAATYAAAIQSSSPGVVLVEEAGEILEAHILTALGPNTEQLILIGDHKQLRPKCSYELSVDRGEGFDLNRSLFERLVLKGFPHVTLTEQHRMRPEISSMVRYLTYPDLVDAPSTLTRSDLLGFQNNVIFLNHSNPETELSKGRELQDGKTSSKQNLFEAQMILKCVRYLAQQGYGSDKLVVLTPYLGQLKLLREQLSKENDPILNDLDRFDLIRAGLLADIGPKSTKPSLRISTIDNYQGEESDIVLASLTRSNNSHDIGFMFAPERLNVLLSRARDALIIIGNSETFTNARKGQEVWRKLFSHLTEYGRVYDGFPIRCEKHPNRTASLKTPEDFEKYCPDGGCTEPCGIMLKCGKHKCPSSCHQIVDHSKMKCMAVLTQKCPKNHPQSWHCHVGVSPISCQRCEHERRETVRKAQKALKQQEEREKNLQNHLKEMAKLQDEIDQVAQKMADSRIEAEQNAALAQRKKDLENAKELAKKKISPPKNAQTNNPHPSVTSSKAQPPQLRTKSTTGPTASPLPEANPKSAKGKVEPTSLPPTLVNQKPSPANIDWQRQKAQEGAINPTIDELMQMIGLEAVKAKVLQIKAKVETSLRQGVNMKKERLGLVLLGNPGTGKTTVARHYAKILSSLQVLPGNGFIETTGSRLAHGGVAEVKTHLQKLQASGGGVYFIDEAYQLVAEHTQGGKMVLDFLLAEIESLTGEVVFIFAGYRSSMEKFFAHNVGFESRIPYTLLFEDYTNEELMAMLQFKILKCFEKRGINIDGGIDGLYMRIAVRRLGSGRGRDGFGNARALENLFSRIRDRQADRLAKERRQGLLPDDYTITQEDLIGPDPSKAILQCSAWDELQKLIGLSSVKNSVNFMIDLIKTNYDRELQEKHPVHVSLNRIFLGSPGTGKTTVAKLYGQVLRDLGMLSNGEVVTKNPSDFIGSYVGHSEANTKAILASTIGKVLIIDEAYMLSSTSKGGDGGSGSNTDTFKTAVIDTIVAEVQSVPGEDRCVLLLGYEDEMKRFFQNVNPGLTRRFQLSDAFKFEDFSNMELEEILRLKLKQQGLGATAEAIPVAINVLDRARNGLNFGNGGDVENLISKAKASYQQRQSSLPSDKRSTDFVFEPHDFDTDFNRASFADTNLQELFKDVIGCESIVAKLDGYLKVAKGMRAQGLEPRGQIPMNFIFKGPPGTGKTTTARKFGQVYYDLGFLSKVEVVECGASDLIGQYVGQTGPKTTKQLEKGLGKVLFIDEAYRLGEGRFAQEAVDELVDSMTKPKFAGKMLIILAGYDKDMNNLLRVNEGLSSRFADEIHFPPLAVGNCLQLLELMLKQSIIDCPTLQDPVFGVKIKELSKLPAWGNARDIQTLAKSMVRAVFQINQIKAQQLTLPHDVALKCVDEMLLERRSRMNTTLPLQKPKPDESQEFSQSSSAPPPSTSNSAAAKATTNVRKVPQLTPQGSSDEDSGDDTDNDVRDPGVSDTVWQQLQEDRQRAISEALQREEKLKKDEAAYSESQKLEGEAIAATTALLAAEAKKKAEAAELLRKLEEARIREQNIKDEQDRIQAELERQRLAEIQAKIQAEALELLRKREEARIRELKIRQERERIQGEIQRQKTIEQERRRKEEQVQKKLRQMGVCVAGYRWIEQGDGYRCAGGAHYVSNLQLGQ
ncbi:NFX1-type zinc finger-containing protein 1 [Tricladium varicosporioides]|nr:NFX1-type zinc finger-containing protein 1 [Hymenoscyphus varicosporioides]